MIVNSLIGFFSGIISGMGIGGGTILIPALIFFAGITQKVAQGVNLLYFIPTALASLFIHFKNRNIEVKVALSMLVPGIIGALAGSYMANTVSNDLLRKIYAVFLFLMGIYELFKKKNH